MCHMQGSTGTIADVFLSELAAHKAHGDYVTALDVDKLNKAGDSIHFTRIADALAAACAVRLAHGEGTKAAMVPISRDSFFSPVEPPPQRRLAARAFFQCGSADLS